MSSKAESPPLLTEFAFMLFMLRLTSPHVRELGSTRPEGYGLIAITMYKDGYMTARLYGPTGSYWRR